MTLIKRKLIFVSNSRLTDKISRDWFIDYAIEKDELVEYWDIVSLVREEHFEHGALEVSYLRRLKTYQEFEELICLPENKNAVYVMLVTYSGRNSKPFRLLSKYNSKMVFLNWGATPIINRHDTSPIICRATRQLFKNPVNFIKIVADVALGWANKKLNLIKKFNIVFVAGSALSSANQFTKKVVPINLCDFDHYLRVKLINQRIVQGRYAVFLDINLAYQSDLAICGLPKLTPDSYFDSLNRFFDFLEDAYNVKVVIARHPKSKYAKEQFNQRESYRLLTAELVKDAEFVITHTSTALSYAVLNSKPIIFIYTDEMMGIYKNTFMREIKSSANYLNASIYNIDEITNRNQIEIKPPNQELYESYKYSYLTSRETENKVSAEIFWDEINSL